MRQMKLYSISIEDIPVRDVSKKMQFVQRYTWGCKYDIHTEFHILIFIF